MNIILAMEKEPKLKTYTCPRCGKRFLGRSDRCPRCGQLIVYLTDGKYYNSLGDELILTRNKRFIRKIIRNKNRPK